MQISMRSFGLRRAGLTMLARTSAAVLPARLDGANMLAAGAMTALAVDAFREVAGEDRVAAGGLVAGGNLRNRRYGRTCTYRRRSGGCADDRNRSPATWPSDPPDAPCRRPFRIPAERQFDQRSARRAMQIGSRMIARAHDVIDLQLLDVGFFAVEADLPAPLIVLAVAESHRKVRVGEGVVEIRCAVAYGLQGVRGAGRKNERPMPVRA